MAASTLAFDGSINQPAQPDSWAALDSAITQVTSACQQAGYTLRWEAPASSPAPAPTCAMFQGIHATYALVSQTDAGTGGRDYWPRITVTNASQVPITASVMGTGKATDPSAPSVPSHMEFDGQSPTVAAGQSLTFDVGKDTGETIFVAGSGRITSVTMSMSVQMDSSVASDAGNPGLCDATITPAR